MTIATELSAALAAFDAAAQDHGWASDQGSATRAAEALSRYTATKETLLKLLSARAGVWINPNDDQANGLAASDPPAGPLDYMVPRVAASLKAAIKDRGVSQAELARRLECSVAEVSDRLSGRRNLTLSTMAEMCDLTGLRMEVRFYAPSAGFPSPAGGETHAIHTPAGHCGRAH